MLDSLRRASGGWVAKTLLVLLVLSFAVWGISGSLMQGVGGDRVVTVGGTVVTASDYRLAWNRQVTQLSQQFGQQLTREQARAFGIDEQVLGQLVAGAVLDEQARTMRLGVTEERMAQQTVEDPSFQGADGRFDRQRFNYVLNQIGMRQDDYFRNQEQVAVRQQIVEAVADGLAAPDTFLRAAALHQGEDRTVEYLLLPQSLVEPISEPAPDALASWFETRKANYAAPEYRTFSYVRLNPEDIADEGSVTDEQVRADYDTNRAQFTTPERRAIDQLVFANDADAQAALASLASGTTFEQLVSNQNRTMSDVALGTLSRDQLSDPAVAEAAFALAQGATSPVIQGAFGPVIVRVTAITPEVVQPFDAVAPRIRSDLALAEASRVLLDTHDAYEDARAGGASLADAAQSLRLTVRTVDGIDRSGLGADGNPVADLPDARDLLPSVFEAEPNTENVAVTTASGGYVFYEVQTVTPPRDRTLEEVRDRALADWKAEEAQRLLSARTEELKKRLVDGSATLDVLATELALSKETKRGLKRGANDGDFGQAGVAAAFAVAEGGVGSVQAPEPTAQLLFRVTETFEPAAADASTLPQNQRDAYALGIGNDILDQMIAQLQSRYTVEINRDAATRAVAN